MTIRLLMIMVGVERIPYGYFSDVFSYSPSGLDDLLNQFLRGGITQRLSAPYFCARAKRHAGFLPASKLAQISSWMAGNLAGS